MTDVLNFNREDDDYPHPDQCVCGECMEDSFDEGDYYTGPTYMEYDD